MMQTDKLIIATAITAAAVTIYQLGAKVADIFLFLHTAIARNHLSWRPAHLHAKGDRKALQRLLVDGTRFNVMVATPLYCCAPFIWKA